MKKLMFAAAAALCATVASAEIQSNVVGYQEKGTEQGYSLFTPTFTDVGVKSVDLQNIKLVDAVGSETEFIQTFTAGGAIDKTYAYLTDAADGMPDGWYDNWVLVEGATVDSGKGFILYNTSGSAKLNFAGEVTVDAQSIAVPVGYSIVGNSIPKAIDIQQLKLANAIGSETEFIQTFTAGGAIDKTYAYLTDAADGMPDGWYDNWVLVEGVTVEAATSFLIYNTAATELKLELPAAISSGN